MKFLNRKNAMSFLLKTSLFLILSVQIACSGKQEETTEKDKNSGGALIAELTEKISQNPNDPDLYFERAGVYYEEEAYEESIADLTKAIQLDSTKAEYFHLMADNYLDYRQSMAALRTMELAANKFPKNIPTLLKQAEFQHILKQYEDSFRTIDQILKQDPQNAEAYFMFGMNFKEMGDTIRAINSFQSAVENDPDLVDAWIILGQLYAQRGDALAEKYFNNAIRADSTNKVALHAKAAYLHDLGKLEAALDIYKKIVLMDPKYKDAFFNSGLIYLEMDSLNQAKKQFDILIEVSPTYIVGYYYRGLVSEMQGDMQAAKDDFQQALKFAPNYGEAQLALDRVAKSLQ